MKLSDRVIVRGYKGKEVEGVVVSLERGLVGITTLAEREDAAKTARDPIVIGFPARDVRLVERKAAAGLRNDHNQARRRE